MAAYYFAAGGNDSNAGTSSASPFRTIAKLNALTLLTGDIVHFNAGDNLPGSYTAVSGVTYTSYGTGNLPVISGFDILSGWVAFGGGVYYATDANLGATVKNVTLDGSPATLGRFPKTGYRTYTAHNANLSITDLTLPDSPSYVGAQVVIKKLHYVIDTGVITAQSAGVISYTGTSTQLPQNNYGYFLQNSPSFLTQLGEWSYDANTKRVYMFFGTNDPNAFVAKASRYDIVANYSGKTGCNTNNIAFEGANATAGVRGSGGSNNTFDLCQILNSGADGFFFSNASAITVTNSNIQNCLNNGNITLYTFNSKLNNNYYAENGNIAGRTQNGFGVSGFGSGNGISLGTNSATTDHDNQCMGNTVINSGYIGIYANGSSYTCTGNYVNGACLIKDDGAGIYTWTGPTAIVYAQRTISNNIVVNVPGCTIGTDGAFGNEGNGIYADDNSSNLTISGNSVAHVGNYALLLHNGHEITISNNKFFDAPAALVAMLHDNAAIVTMQNITITNNEFYSLTTAQLMYYFRSTASNSAAGDISTWGTASGNQYGAFHNTTALFRIQLPASNVTGDFTAWKAATATDSSASVFSNISAYLTKYLFIYNETSAAKSFSLSGVYKDIFNTSYSGAISLATSHSLMLLQTATALVPIISYSPSTKIFTQGLAITNMTPISTGGAATSYSILPSLPSGLSFNTTTGIISGTPTALSAATSYTISATNTAGTSTTTINLTVNAVIPSISYPQPSYAFTQQTAIANVIPSNTGGAVVSYSITPALPSGLSFNTSTGVISGTPTGTSASVSYAITSTNTGGNSTTSISIFIYPQLPNISYSPSTEIYLIGTAITPIGPTNTGGAIVSYAISSPLPAGLSFNTTTGQISGTPTALSPATTYTVTATNANGTSTANITITVNSIAPNISYSPNTEILIQSVAMTAMSPINTGGAASYSISPALPLGLNLNSSTGVISGSPTVLSMVTTYTVTATNVTGTSNANVTLSVIAKLPSFYYSPATNNYTINLAIAILAPINTGGTPVSYAVSPSLPTGLTFNTSTGGITGIPTVLQGAVVYTITATNTGGTGSTTISLAVIAPAAPTIKKKRIH